MIWKFLNNSNACIIIIKSIANMQKDMFYRGNFYNWNVVYIFKQKEKKKTLILIFYALKVFKIILQFYEFFLHYMRVYPRLKNTQGAENKKRVFLIFLRAYFWFPKRLLNLKVYDNIWYVNKYRKKASFLFFYLKGKKGAYFLNEGQQGCYSFCERAGRAQRASETVWGETLLLIEDLGRF